MADKIEDGGPAFPFNAADHGYEPSSGMSLRDYFATAALPILMVEEGYRDPFIVIAKQAYEMADAMLKARKGEL